MCSMAVGSGNDAMDHCVCLLTIVEEDNLGQNGLKMGQFHLFVHL